MPFELLNDASLIGIGAVLTQEHRAMAYASRTLNKAERKYTVSELECLVVMWTLNKFCTYLGPLPVKVIRDHAALTKLTHGKNLSSRMIRWVLKLAEFNVEWEHRAGAQNVVADILSRNPVEKYVLTYDVCQKCNYNSALPSNRLIPIVTSYLNEIVSLDLLGPY
ncbi:retrovirus-related Pol polyprotein from transposon opus [Trichonephila clavipes]|nr:retrovirus-related Pol polyprotein from transposon opus [Trichonephila clavipes]